MERDAKLRMKERRNKSDSYYLPYKLKAPLPLPTGARGIFSLVFGWLRPVIFKFTLAATLNHDGVSSSKPYVSIKKFVFIKGFV